MTVETPELPQGWSVRVPGGADVPALVALSNERRQAARVPGGVDTERVESMVVGPASWTRRQLVAEHDGELSGWVVVHDRAAGRTGVDLVVRPDVPGADEVAGALLGWAAATARAVVAERGLTTTQLDASPYVAEQRLKQWLTAAGYRKTRTWLQMTRPVDDAAALPPPREGVVVRRVATHDNGVPVAADLQRVHRVLEESFADHFNSYRESFPEFLQRLREDPGHRWDHWWIAEVDVDGETITGGALVATVSQEDATGSEGSYVDYIGVHRDARGRGIAKALLHTVIRDAHDLGRNRVGLEVDADSPTGADALYRSMGWTTSYETESWHAECRV
ncbi:GNAT family N-acetyltransferase [Nocardioides caldifontis]|uniref:GNAT family N-acetyltransferase n=1 Tax=Nocardioides caldifontis TaxID=2588938 RepID=UPI001EF0AFB6|nr:GNAT family N-acetyltransferase [Nocardioides caldifontis]